jgi:hypothetical protein
MAGSKPVRPRGAFPAPVGIIDQLIPAFDQLIVTFDQLIATFAQLIGVPRRFLRLVTLFWYGLLFKLWFALPEISSRLVGLKHNT